MRGRKREAAAARPRPPRRCHDCRRPTPDYRCPACLAKWREKYGVIGDEEEEAPLWLPGGALLPE